MELRSLRQWVLCGPNKVPLNARTRSWAKSNDPETWSGFAAVEHAPLFGFVPTDNDPYVVVDLDKCRNPETGEIAPWARAIVERLGGYWEVSQSETGLHNISRGVLPNPGKHNKDIDGGGKVEIWDRGQYVALTGDVLPGYGRIRNCQQEIKSLFFELWPVHRAKVDRTDPKTPPITIGDRPDIARIKEVAFGLSNGEKLRRLHERGDISEYNHDASRGDAALALMWAPFTADDGQLEDLMRDSELVRQKWDRKGDNYLARTIKAARKVQTWWWDWNRQTRRQIIDGVDQETGEILDDADSADVVDSEEVERWKARAIEAERDRSQLIALMLNPHIKHAEKLALVRTGQLVLKKQPDGEGRVGIKAAEIANDWRAKPEPGENTAITNADGSVPLMSRGSVNGVMKRLTGDKELGCKKVARLIDAEGVAQKVTPKNGTQPWAETVWYVPRPASLGDFLAEAATFSAERKRKLRTITPPCPECGEIHPRTVKTTTEYQCHGCGGSWSEEGAERVEWPIVQIGPDETGPMPVEEYERQQAERRASAPQHAQQSPLPPTEDPEPPDPEPDEAAPHAGGLKFTGTHSRTCRDCFAELEEGQFTLCRSCSAEYKRKRDQADRVRRAGTHPCTECGEPTATLGTRYCPAHGGASAEVAS